MNKLNSLVSIILIVLILGVMIFKYTSLFETSNAIKHIQIRHYNQEIHSENFNMQSMAPTPTDPAPRLYIKSSTR